MSALKAFDPSQQARRDPYYKRNHMGRVTCTLCDLVCTDDNNFLKHLSGKTHRAQLERIARYARREERIAAEAERNRAATERAEHERALLQQQQQQQQQQVTPTLAPFGRPTHHFCTEHDPEMHQTKVWLTFFFPQVTAGARPLHRWRSAREQEMERPPDDQWVYLLIACEGYVTVGMKFPSRLQRTTGQMELGGGIEEEGRYSCDWDPIKKVYTLFFIIG